MRVCVAGYSSLEDSEEERRDAELRLGSTNNAADTLTLKQI